MRAIVQPAYGTPDVLSLERIPAPEVGAGEVLVQVHAASVGRGDVHMLTGTPYLIRLMGYGLRRPTKPVPGHAIAGRVVAMGSGVERFQLGDAVHGEIDRGAFAEYANAPAEQLALVPPGLDFEQAAAVPVSATTALQGLRDVGGVRAGQRVLINGASGGVGSYAVQIAKALGAEVTGVCSTRNVERARALGADHVVDYTQTDFAKDDARYDVMFDVVGNRKMADCLRVLERGGIYVAAAGKMGNWLGPILWMLRVKLAGLFRSKRTATFINQPGTKDLDYLRPLFAAGKLTAPIERVYALEEAPDAIRRMVAGHAQGKLVIRVRDE
jgi:NADPH:quinone reductase-like Zn-dependent oxidoreductase